MTATLSRSAAAERFRDRPGRLLIDGELVDAARGERFTVIDPTTEEELGQVARAGTEDVDRAVTAARAAFADRRWSGLPRARREAVLHRLADLVEGATAELAALDVLENGMPLAFAQYEIGSAVAMIRYFAGWPTKVESTVLATDDPIFGYTRREPVGVCAGIAPWNAPVTNPLLKIVPALACGNTVIAKPAEQTPLTAVRIAELCLEAGIPPGVVNVLQGPGDVGAALVAHPGVDKIAFTGSTATGKLIQREAAATLKRVTLELGGKSPNILFADADLEAAIPGALMAVFANSGQVCFAGTRLFVERPIHDAVVEALAAGSAQMVVGDGFDPATQLGPLVSAAQFDRVRGYIEAGVAGGATLAHGGDRVGDRGYFVRPTVFAGADNTMRIAREEIFGPVVTVIPFDDESEVLRLADDTNFGLGAGVWTRDLSRAHRVAASLRAGVVWVNTYGDLSATVPFGGFKQSGIGREFGTAALDAYTEHKSVLVKL
ncbi:aldehyde dehydrogenase family protein [Cryptosporangium aurantiacum]|uniref:Aldehyde dehydrogenase (Acceptor) n=1 Tax=Cryptosporangium aurantiacum TaxID=134849 RepID=A0A1M7R520_9ACTN|nr:aldehyde dehydrogenase family protein [Cryptosporangium aurantiacum]SHN40146.1 aldehyde dehydrogenase (acceptor) [Cryptosporangium aurantiacum]